MKIPKRLIKQIEPIEESIFPAPSEIEEGGRILQRGLLETVESQLAGDTPPEARITYQRLLALGYSESDSKKFMAKALAEELYAVFTNKRMYDEENYVAALRALPDSAYE